MVLIVVFLLSVLCVAHGSSLPRTIPIGGLFESEKGKSIFQFSVEYVNQKELIGQGIQFTQVASTTSYLETFGAIQMACRHAETGIVALIGPSTSTSTKAVSPVSAALHLPQITPSATDSGLANRNNHPFLLRMMPQDSLKSRALVDLVTNFGWTKFAILTSNTDFGIHGLVEFQEQASYKGWTVSSVQQFQASKDVRLVNATTQLKVIRETGVRIVLLNCLGVFARKVLKQAKALGMTEAGWAWIVTDIYGIVQTSDDKSQNSYFEGLIGVTSGTGRGSLWTDFAAAWDANQRELSDGKDSLIPWAMSAAESTYIVDAVLAIAYAIRDMHRDHGNINVSQETLRCDQQPIKPWIYGDLLLNYTEQVQGEGVGNDISFNSNAGPKTSGFDILNFRNGSLNRVGTWDTATGLKLPNRTDVTFMGGRKTVLDHVSILTNQTLNVITALYEPFTMMTTDEYNISDIQPHQIEGYCMDMLVKLAEIIGFKYRLYQTDGKFGVKDPVTREWDGMIRELVDRKADLAVSGITISQVREIDVDFTTPFIDLGYSFIIKVQEEEQLRPFRFLDPLSSELWMHILLAAFIVGVYLSFLNRLSPYDYHGSFVYCDSHKEGLHQTSRSQWRLFNRIKHQEISKLDFSNSIMSSVSCLLKQGAENYPKSLSGRVTSAAWWMATVFIVATYTANLAAFMQAERVQTSINSVEDLAAQTKIAYGFTTGGSIKQFFMDSKVALYQDIWYYVSSRGYMIKGADLFLPKVREGGFAYISESVSLEYLANQKPCNTIQLVGREFAKQGFGIALTKNSPYKEELSSHILQLREAGYFEDLYRKWLVDRSECGTEKKKVEVDDVPKGQLQISHMLGVFYVIYGGLIVGFALLLVEFVVKAFQSLHKSDSSITLCGALVRRWKLFKDDFWTDIFPQFRQCYRFKQTEDFAIKNGSVLFTENESKMSEEIKCMH